MGFRVLLDSLRVLSGFTGGLSAFLHLLAFQGAVRVLHSRNLFHGFARALNCLIEVLMVLPLRAIRPNRVLVGIFRV